MKNNILKKLLLMVAVASIVVLSMTTCNSKKEKSEADSQTKGSLEFWTMFTGADNTNMQAMIDAYNATNPEYTINHRALEANDLYLKLPLAIQSGVDIPTLAMNHIERIPIFVENGFLVDFNTIIDGSSIKAENYNPKPWALSEINGGHYGIPMDYNAFVTYVNMDLYGKYGNGALDDGYLTWDEVKASGEAAKADGIIPVGTTWLRAFWLSTYGQLGGTMTTDDTEVKITDNNALEALNILTELFEAGYTQKEGDNAWKMFLGGQVLYCPAGIWMLNNAIESDINYKMIEYIAYDTDTRGQWASSHNFVMPVDKKRPQEEVDAALDFIQFMGNNSLEWAKAGQVPAHVSILEVEEFKDMPQYFLTENDDSLKMFDYKYYGYVVESLDKVFSEVLFGRMTPEDALMQAEQEARDRISIEG